MTLSIIIVNYKSSNYLKSCLASILKQDFDFEYEIIVVDNGSQDNFERVVADFQNKKIKFIQAGKNLGFAKANNLGFKHSQGKYLLFLNPDTAVIDNSWDIVIRKFNEDPSLAACTGQLFYDKKCTKRQKNIKNHPSFCSQVLILLKLHHFLTFIPCVKNYLQLDFDYSKESQIEQIMGAYIFVRRDVFEKIDHFSPDYPLWWEDIDLCYQLSLKNFKIMYFPQTKIIHYEGKSFETVYHTNTNLLKRISNRIKKQQRFNIAMLIFFKKYKPHWQHSILTLLVPINLLLTIATELCKIQPKDQGKI